MIVTPRAVRDYYKRLKLARYPYIIRRGGSDYLRLDVLARYGETRVSKKPHGAVTLKSLTDSHSSRARHHYDELKAAGQIQPLVFRACIYLTPEDAVLISQRCGEERPLPGWVQLVELAERTGRGYGGLHRLVGRAGLEVRTYRGHGGRLSLYVLEHEVLAILNPVRDRT